MVFGVKKMSIGTTLESRTKINADVNTSDDSKLIIPNLINYGNIGFIGLGDVGSSSFTQLVHHHLHELINIKEINLFYREEKEKEKERVNILIDSIPESSPNLSINTTPNLYDLGQDSGIILIALGHREEEIGGREKLIGKYFNDIVDIMEGLGDSKATIFMATNNVTANCLAAYLSSEQENPNIVGFTRLDYRRPINIIEGWLRGEGYKNLEADLNVLGPHGKGLIVTNIIMGNKEKGWGNPIFDNNGLNFYFEDNSKTIERLSRETAEKGEQIHKYLKDSTNPTAPGTQVVESIKLMLEGGKDTAAIGIDLSEICGSGLDMPKCPTFMSLPIVYKKGIPKIDPSFDSQKIPENYRMDLLKTLYNEQETVKNYLIANKGLRILKNHFDL